MNYKKYPISIASYSFNGLLADGRTDVFTYLEDLKYRYNVEHADIWSGFLPNFTESCPSEHEALLKKIKFSMDEKGISLANLCVDGPHLWMDTPEEREKHRKGAHNYLKAGVMLGAKTVRIDSGVREDSMTDEQFDYVVKIYKELAAIAKANNMRVGTENHWGATRDPKILDRMWEAIGSDGYGHLFHFDNFFEGQEQAGLEAVLKMAMHTHVPAAQMPVAKEYIRRLVNAGYKGTFSIEHHTGKHEYERVAWQIATVRALISELEDEGFDKPAQTDFFREVYGANNTDNYGKS